MQPLTPDQHKRIERLFDAAMEQQPSDIGVWLSAQCPDDEIVREHVRKLLLASAATANIRDHLDPKHLNFSPALNDDTAGESIGPYRLLEVIGEGGFGVVWLAERREPMVQCVALKIIKPGMDSKAVIARFEQERQALAVMDHPNVAKVLDGGVTKNGRPYFVMEHVKGEPITAFADRHRLTIKQRLELFIPVCEAVQHAHMKGIIHRDIKPSNILVVPGGEGQTPIVKVIDFGVAKAISHTLTDKTIFTERGQIIGTPEYMSPEQAEMGSTDIDTRTDVYSLGVVLYELLSGTLPFDAKTLRSAGFAEIQRIIREVDPPKPSTKLSTADDATGADIARARQAEREKIAGELRRELEWIPMKALRKDRTRRYASAESMGADVRRYLEGRPLEAAPESRAYLLRKFVRRNRVQVTAGMAVAAALVGGVVATGLALQRALNAEQDLRAQLVETEKAKQAEQDRADQLKKVSDFQSGMLGQIDVKTAGEGLMTDVRERFAGALEKAGVPEAERGAQAATLGDLLKRVNATDTAATMIDRTILKPAIKTIDEQFKNDPTTDASLRQALADLYQRIGLYDAAFPLQESALATRRRLLGEEHPATLIAIGNMGFLLQSQGRHSEAEPYCREALEKHRRVLGEEHPNTITAINNMATLLQDQGKLSEAEPFCREALEKRRRMLGEEHPNTLISIGNMGALLRSQGKLDQAEPFYREALEKFRRVLGEEHPNTLTSVFLMVCLKVDQNKAREALDLITPYEPAARKAFTGGNARRLADFLTGFGRARVGVGYDADGFKLAEANLLEAHPIYIAAKDRGPTHKDTLECVQALVDLYTSWDKAEPGKGYDAKAAEWRATLDDATQPTQ